MSTVRTEREQVVAVRRSSSSSSSSGSSTTTTTVEDYQILLRNHVEQLRQLYAETLGSEMSAANLRQLLLSVSRGTPWQYYQYALEETALAPAPSWRYTLAIVRRLIAEEAPADNVRGSQQKPPQGRSRRILSEQDYTQREYRHDESRVDAMMDAWQRGQLI